MAVDSEYKTHNVAAKYKALKESPACQDALMTLRLLKSVLQLDVQRTGAKQHALENLQESSLDFIMGADGDTLQLLSFTKLDFKQILLQNALNADMQKYLARVLALIYKETTAIVRIYTSPDVDVEKFAEVMTTSITNLKGTITGCDDAFSRINESMDLFKSNFGDYYKDFLVSQGNPGTIIERFVKDVSQNAKTDKKTVRQFNKIIAFYNEKMKTQTNLDPKMRKMMDLAIENMNVLSGVGNAPATVGDHAAK